MTQLALFINKYGLQKKTKIEMIKPYKTFSFMD